MNKNQRRRRFIDSKVQLALVRQLLTQWLVFLFMVLGLLFALQVAKGSPQLSLGEHLAGLWSEYSIFFVIAIFIMPIYVLDVICLSHRFVGPIFRVRRELRRIADGEAVAPIELRRNDFWHELADDFNATLATINRRKAMTQDAPLDDDQEEGLDQEAQLVNSR